MTRRPHAETVSGISSMRRSLMPGSSHTSARVVDRRQQGLIEAVTSAPTRNCAPDLTIDRRRHRGVVEVELGRFHRCRSRFNRSASGFADAR